MPRERQEEMGRPAVFVLLVAGLLAGVEGGCDPDGGGSGGSASGGMGAPTGGTTSTGSAGGESGSAASAGAGGGACRVPEQSAPPFTTTFRFTNPGPDPRWLYSNPWCQIDFDLTSCSDGYQRTMNVIAPGYASCYDICPTCDFSVCEGCQMQGVLVAAGSYHDVAWKGDDPVGDTAPFGDSGASCSCTRLPNAPAGLYRISVPVWTSALVGGSPAYTVTWNFTLDHAGGIVEVKL
jgi:hypothetical protein